MAEYAPKVTCGAVAHLRVSDTATMSFGRALKMGTNERKHEWGAWGSTSE